MGVVPFMLLQAALAGWCCYRARAWLDARAEWLGIPFILPVAACCLVTAPAAVYLLRFQPAWFLHYAADPSGGGFDTFSFVFSLALLGGLALATLGGFSAVRYAVKHLNAPYCLAPAPALAGMALLFLVIFHERALRVATAAEWAAGGGASVFTHVAGAVSVVPVLAGWLAAMLTARWFPEEARSSVPPRPGVSTSVPPIT